MALAKPKRRVGEPPVRVVQLLGAKSAGGAETFFVRLMAGLAKRPDEIAVLPVVRKGSWAAGRLKALGVPFEEARFGGWWDVMTRCKVARLAQQFGADVVMGWMNRGAAFVPRGPWVRAARLGGYYKFKYYKSKIDYLIGNTEDLCAYLKQEWDAEKVACVGNFIPEPEEGWTREAAAVRARWGIEDGSKVVVMAARLHQVKGWDVVLAALARWMREGRDVVLVAMGEGPEQEALMQMAEEMGVGNKVRWVGWADSVSPYAAMADVWLVASRQETLGNSVLDAWVHGVPVVATRTQGPLQLIADGTNGVLVDIEDVAELAAAVAKVLDDKKLAAKLVAGGKAAFEKDFAEEVIVGQFIAYYQSLKEKGGR